MVRIQIAGLLSEISRPIICLTYCVCCRVYIIACAVLETHCPLGKIFCGSCWFLQISLFNIMLFVEILLLKLLLVRSSTITTVVGSSCRCLVLVKDISKFCTTHTYTPTPTHTNVYIVKMAAAP